jgi:hypothetical protein
VIATDIDEAGLAALKKGVAEVHKLDARYSRRRSYGEESRENRYPA